MSTQGLTPQLVVDTLKEEGTVTGAARSLGVNRNTLHSYIHRHEIDITGGAAKAVWQGISENEQVLSEDSQEWGDLLKLIESRGLKPHEWRIIRARINVWGDNQQLRADLEPLGLLPFPARSEGWKPPKDAKSRTVQNGLIAFFGDQHCPFHDVGLHRAAVAWLREHRPEKLCLLGDLLDYAAVSKHRKIGNEASLQETIDSAYSVLRAYKEASPGTQILMLEGNHEDRLRNALSDKGLLSVSAVRKAETNGVPVLSTAHLLRFDELEIEQVFPPAGASYEHAEIKVTPLLAARHGHIATSGSGVSALKTLHKLRRNIVIGHTHRQSIVFHTHWDIKDQAHRLIAVEAGCMADITDGMHYASAGAPDWQQGFAVAQMHSDDRFTLDLASYVDGRLIWRDREYRAV